jgi:hypothetical protein
MSPKHPRRSEKTDDGWLCIECSDAVDESTVVNDNGDSFGFQHISELMAQEFPSDGDICISCSARYEIIRSDDPDIFSNYCWRMPPALEAMKEAIDDAKETKRPTDHRVEEERQD